MTPRPPFLAALAATLAFALGALAGGITMPTAQVYWSETQAGTRAAPDGGTQGFSLGGLTSFHAVASCTDGSNVTAGSGLGYYYSPKLATWSPAPSYTNCTLPTGGPNAVCPELQVANPFGRFLFAGSGVTCSGGSWDGGVLWTVEQAQQ